MQGPLTSLPPGDGADHWLTLPPAPGDHPSAIRPLALRLMPERAVFDPIGNTLFVADVHIGKAAVFRARGLPVPRGTTTATLARLSQALARSRASRLVVLGDFLHASESHAPATMEVLSAWRSQHAAVDCLVVEGNHDRHAGRVQDELGIRTLDGDYVGGRLRGMHEPPHAMAHGALGGALVLAGHVHPVVRVGTRRDSLRLPCFWLRGHVLTLPAFGEFTGGYLVGSSRHDPESPPQRFFVVADTVMPLPDRRRP